MKIENMSEKTLSDEDIKDKFRKIYDKAVALGLTADDFQQLDAIKEIKDCLYEKERRIFKYIFFTVVGTVGVLYGIFFAYLLDWPIGRESMLRVWFGLNGLDITQEDCVIGMPEFVSDVFRPPVECDFCKNLTEVDRVSNISPVEFEESYAYTGVPVIIEDGTLNWTAPEVFSFDFFKEIYKEGSQALDNQERHCQFFPYKTSFNSLSEVMQMSSKRARMEDGSEPWYIGWSNCDFSAANTLRKHYKRPYFLPELSESSKTDWIFMGSPGYGAHLHIDNVENPSWQAQITGTKKWTLEPPPECYYTCPDRIEVTVQPGQIIVLDTNIWYHSTLNVGSDISICIGSEYD